MCNGKLYWHKETFQSLDRSEYQCLRWSSVCQVPFIPFEEQTKSFIAMRNQGICISEEILKSIRDTIGDVYCPGRYCSGQKCVSVNKWKEIGASLNEFLQF